MSIIGSIVADFAGTLAEARSFAKDLGIRAPSNWLHTEVQRANGCACVSIPYNGEQRLAAITRMEELGWEQGSWHDTRGVRLAPLKAA